jgi:hypothetical protein
MCNGGNASGRTALLKADCSDPELVDLMFLFTHGPTFADLTDSSQQDGVTVVLFAATVAIRFATHCSKGIANANHRHVSTNVLQRKRNGCASADTTPAYRTECSAIQHALSPLITF